MSYKNQQLNVNNVTSHTHTVFDLIATEAGQQKIVDAINNINISAEIGDITVESSDSVTHQKLDTINNTISNKHLNYESDSVSVANFPTSFQVSNFPISTEVSNFPTSFQVSNFPISTEISNFPTSTEVSNFPTSTEVSNFPSSFQVSNFPTSTEISNFPTSTEISNFPLSTEVSNFPTSTQISNFPTSTEVSNLSEVPLITGFATEGTLSDISNKTNNLNFFDNDGVLELNTFDSQVYNAIGNVVNAVNDKHLDSTTDSVTVVGTISIDTTGLALESTLTDVKTAVEKLNNDPVLTDAIQVSVKNSSLDVNITGGNSDYSTETKQDTQIQELEKVVNKKGDIEANIYYNQGATIWVDSQPTPDEYEADPNGWIYNNAEAGNAMNLYYFNGANETKLLNSVVAQYCIVTNLSTKLNDSLIFAIYTKGTPYTTRITHSPANGVYIPAGAKVLCYWGAVPDDLYPNLLRLNFTSVATIGPAVPSEEILSVSLNTDSGAPAGDVVIFIESLGVVFSDGSVNQSRVLNLLSTKTDYILNASNTEFNQLTLAYLGNLNKTSGGLDVYIKNSNIAISNTSFEISNFPATQNSFITNDEYTPIPITGNVGISGNVNVVVANVSPISITGTIDINTLPSVDISNDFTLNTTTEATNTKLDTIHSDLDGLTFDGSSNLNVNIASGSLTVDSVKIKASNGDDLTATSGSLNSNITNNSIDVHCYASSNSTNWHHLSSDSNGQLNIHSKTQDGAGTDISSTDLLNSKMGLDTASNIFGFSISGAETTRTALTCDVSGKLNVRSHNTDYLGNGITSTTTSVSGGATNSLDTASSLYVSNGSTRTALSASGSSLNTNITNTVPISIASTVAVSGDFYQQTQPVSIASTVDVSGSVNIKATNGDSINISALGDLRTLSKVSTDLGVVTSTDITATKIALDTASSLYTADGTNRYNLTSTAINSVRALDINVANSGNIGVNVNNTVPVSGTVAFSNSTIGISGTVATADSTANGYLNTINQGVGYSYIEAIIVPNSTIAGSTIGTYGTWTRGQYRKTVFNYSDGNTANTDSISIYSKDILGGGIMLCTFYPFVLAGARQFSGILELSPFNAIAIRNNSASSISGVSLKIFSA